ncbi:nitronate monooxygenase [Cupriavidus sp. DF5525]|uniref:nitronate monooxygenase n=1 Tax=Cupriavidus sp. DF5525 TaxID=3160989 RepID=UPI0032DE3B6B
MKNDMTSLRQKLGYSVPIFAFSHCRDVVVEVTRAGGFGVLGASWFTPEQLEVELAWIDRHVDGKPYGIDIVVPGKYSKEAEETTGSLDALIPDEHKAYMDTVLKEADVPPLPEEEHGRLYEEILQVGRNRTASGGMRLVEVALQHPQVRLVVSALGEPRADIVSLLRSRGILVGALCGKAEHAERNLKAGVDLLVAVGTEAAGHTGEITTMVLVPQVVAAAAGRVPVLAAGGITRGSQIAAARALGAEGVWTGTIWLGTRESELIEPFQKEVLFAARSEDVARRRCWSGKTVRMIKSQLSEAWERPDAPVPLQAPLQAVLWNPAQARVVRAKRKEYFSYPAGQGVWDLTHERSVKDVMYQLQLEYAEAMERITAPDD